LNPLLRKGNGTSTVWLWYQRTCRGFALSLYRSIPLSVALLSACSTTVVRVNDGNVVAGRAIPPHAYAAFMRGRLLELDEKPLLAAAEYEKVIAFDPAAAEAHVRLGAIHCRTTVDRSNREFDLAFRRSPNSVALWQARTRCALDRSDFASAVLASTRLLELAPNDSESSFLLIDSLERAGRIGHARTLCWALIARVPNDSGAWQRLSALYTGSERTAILREAASHVRAPDGTASRLRFERAPVPSATPTPESALVANSLSESMRLSSESDLVAALTEGDDSAVDRAARRLHLTSLRLAMFAYARGAFAFAHTESLRAYRVAPDNDNAWTLALVTAELLGKRAVLEELLGRSRPTRMQLDAEVANALRAMTTRQVLE